MSTRACYSFKGDGETFHVYKHCDGYPAGAADALEKALTNAWPLPRFEADEFAAAFVAANKTPGGGYVRLLPTGAIEEVSTGDAAFWYLVEREGNDLIVTVRQAFGRVLWRGPLSNMSKWAKR